MIHPRPRPIFVTCLLLAIVFVSALLYLLPTDLRSTSQGSFARFPSDISRGKDANLSVWVNIQSWFRANPNSQQKGAMVEALEAYYTTHLAQLTSGFNATETEAKTGLVIGDDLTLERYHHDLVTIYNEYFVGADPEPWLSGVISRLSVRPPAQPLPECPKQILTTEKTIEDLPKEFARWKELMPDWETKYFDDKGLEEWVDSVLGGTKAQKLWLELPQKVLQTDVFRYMAMLVEGGIYTDSDTAPVIPAKDWGRPYEDATHPILTHLSRLLSYAASPTPTGTISSTGESDPNSPETYNHLFNDDAETDEPSIVISIEADEQAMGWEDFRVMRMARAVQLTQWTMQARPGHPIFLETIGRSLMKAEEVRRKMREADEKGEKYTPPSALDWTGPGTFSDCVYRYLFARYGVRPEELVRMYKPTRFGDILFLPACSFASMNPILEEEQRGWAAVWHGYAGRWREDDPGQQEYEEKMKAELGDKYKSYQEVKEHGWR